MENTPNNYRPHKEGMETTGSKHTVPIAIIIAGLFIAGAVIYTNKDASNTGTQTNKGSSASITIELPPVTSEDHILGNPNADIIIVEYSDTECPFCKNFHATLHQIVDEYGRDGEVAWVYRHFPIEQLHSKALREAKATECAAELGGNTAFWQYIDRVFDVTPSNNGLADSELPNIAEFIGLDRNAFERCINSNKHEDKIAEQIEDVKTAGGRGTPFSVIVSKDGFSAETRNVVLSSTTQLPPNTVYMSDDSKKIAISGALPFSFIKFLLDVALDKEVTADN